MNMVLKNLVAVAMKNKSTGSQTPNDELLHCDGEEEEEMLRSAAVHKGKAYRALNVSTTSSFDNDDIFTDTATAMMFRYEHERMSERGAIEATLIRSEDVRDFLDAIGLRFAALHDTDDFEDTTNPEIVELLLQIRSIFLPELKALWSESLFTPDDETSPIARRETIAEEYFRKPPSAPKNFRISPVQCACKSSPDSSVENFHEVSHETPSKRPRRWFFSDGKVDRFGKSAGASSAGPFAAGKTSPEIRFEIGGNASIAKVFSLKKRTSGMGFGFVHPFSTVKPVDSLHLDGFGPTSGSYIPPTSPICNVSVELDQSRKQ